MSYWNHRVIRHTTKDGDVWYGIHEVYYTSDGSIATMTENPVKPYGESPEEIRHELERMLKACDKPVLDYIDD